MPESVYMGQFEFVVKYGGVWNDNSGSQKKEILQWLIHA